MDRSIFEVAQSINIDSAHLEAYGRGVAKVSLNALSSSRPQGKLILVSAMTPTPAGEGKTTTSIGLAQGMALEGQKVIVALREPSLGPAFGRKGGAVGGGASRVHPADRINLHFTGDFHAITAAHNLLAAVIDNHLHFDKAPRLDPRRITWPRVLDVNDRALRNVVLGLGGTGQGVPRETGFEITAASEVMAVLCLSESAADLRARLGRIVVGQDMERNPVTCEDLKCADAMAALLVDALKPNLVQTSEGVPAFVHGGPFANIAHGCSSVLATRMALAHADWAITEAGFGFDLGGEKFFDIKCRVAELKPAGVVLVATVRALKYHGGAKLAELAEENDEALILGLSNLERHIESVRNFGYDPVIAINRFADDRDTEVELIRAHCEKLGLACASSDHFVHGGEGARSLATAVIDSFSDAPRKVPSFTYALEDSIESKVEKLAAQIYGAGSVSFSAGAQKQIRSLKKRGLDKLPVCIAKTQSSLSDNPKLRGRPMGFSIEVRELELAAAAGFIVVLTGQLLRMPGLPKAPRAEKVRINKDGSVTGIM